MSWIQQCKNAFLIQAEILYAKNKKNGMTKKKIVQQLSKESKIPEKTLTNWWKTEAELNQLCIECQKRPIIISETTGKPLTNKSKYYRLCSPCKIKKQKGEIK
jgi:hypothetical protein